MHTSGNTFNENGHIVVMSFFKYPNKQRIWGMKQMALMHPRVKRREGLIFYKLLGTGGGFGYSHKPDFNTYALLTVWKSYIQAREFESDSDVMADYRNHADEVYSIIMQPVKSKGTWSGKNPFEPQIDIQKEDPVVVLTRATLKLRFVPYFWRRVSGVSKAHEGLNELLFSKGVGERPWVEQATFSIWKSVTQMEQFAHGEGGKHAEAVYTTRKYSGFKEDLYARFKPIETTGTWKQADPLGEYLKNYNATNKSVIN
ncbi:MAG: spheroidene monooxygenase [Cyclobacteriaceae bacterium]|nr:spheroidene monooxygenase [Cyclobacteriaceae bacterium]